MQIPEFQNYMLRLTRSDYYLDVEVSGVNVTASDEEGVRLLEVLDKGGLCYLAESGVIVVQFMDDCILFIAGDYWDNSVVYTMTASQLEMLADSVENWLDNVGFLEED